MFVLLALQTTEQSCSHKHETTKANESRSPHERGVEIHLSLLLLPPAHDQGEDGEAETPQHGDAANHQDGDIIRSYNVIFSQPDSGDGLGDGKLFFIIDIAVHFCISDTIVTVSFNIQVCSNKIFACSGELLFGTKKWFVILMWV